LSSTDKVLAGFEQLSQSTTQPVSQSTSQPHDKLTSQQVIKPTTQPADKSAIRKATFQLNEAVLQQLDKFHLQLQLELGKGSAPYKEVIVEEALARLLEQAQLNPEELIAVLRLRQEKRK
jgi:hypothetical protein